MRTLALSTVYLTVSLGLMSCSSGRIPDQEFSGSGGGDALSSSNGGSGTNLPGSSNTSVSEATGGTGETPMSGGGSTAGNQAGNSGSGNSTGFGGFTGGGNQSGTSGGQSTADGGGGSGGGSGENLGGSAGNSGPEAGGQPGRGGSPTMGTGGSSMAGGSGGEPANSSGGSGGGSSEPTGPAPVGETGTMTIPGSGCTAPGAYANLFVSIGGHTQEETDAKVAAAWDQLFSPSNPNTVYYDGPGGDESYVKDTGNNDVRTEGMSYGMMTAVQLDKQTEFDRLWAWVKNHMANGTGEISWHCSTGGSKLSSGGAPDGEEYMATALIFAQRRWGDSGRFDYASEAQWVLDLIRTKYFNEMYHIVKFVSGSNNTDGSYVLPAFYQVWACFDTENADFWDQAVSAGREFFHAAAGSNGVIPDQSSFTGQALGGAGSDAKRCVMNIMMDTNFFAADSWQTDTYAPAYGNTMRNGGDNTAAQFSCNALLGFGLPEDTGKSFVDKLWGAKIPSGTYRYYDGTLYMLALLHVSGAFKLYY